MTPAEMDSALRMVVALTFLFACVAKVRHPEPLQATMKALSLRGAVMQWVAIATLLLCEGALATTLFIDFHSRLALDAAVGLIVVFTAVLAILMQRGYQRSCGCFGGRGDVAMRWTPLLRNGLICAIALLARFGARSPIVVPAWRMTPRALGVAALIFGVSAFIHTIAEQVESFFVRARLQSTRGEAT